MTIEVLRAFHDCAELKDHYLARVRAHAAADRLVQGTGWGNGKGCAIGCTLENYDHSQYPVELGIPLILAHLEDRMFELLPLVEAMTWPERFLDAVRPGADLTMVAWRFLAWLVETELAKWATPESAKVVDLLCRRIAGDEPTYREWSEANYACDKASAAAAASAYASAYAAYSAAASAAVYAAVYAASAVYAAADAADAARAASIQRQSAKLLELLAEAW
jgi:hypothetical protein